MNKYIPKVGEECEVINTSLFSPEYEKCFPVFVGEHVIVYNSDSCTERMGKFNYCTFRKIQTKADVEREQILSLMSQSGFFAERVSAIQKAGFTIPKRVKRSELKKIINHHHGDSAVSYTKTVDILICELLGDLVEQDEKGGAE
jgi:hypothetical protein